MDMKERIRRNLLAEEEMQEQLGEAYDMLMEAHQKLKAKVREYIYMVSLDSQGFPTRLESVEDELREMVK